MVVVGRRKSQGFEPTEGRREEVDQKSPSLFFLTPPKYNTPDKPHARALKEKAESKGPRGGGGSDLALIYLYEGDMLSIESFYPVPVVTIMLFFER